MRNIFNPANTALNPLLFPAADGVLQSSTLLPHHGGFPHHSHGQDPEVRHESGDHADAGEGTAAAGVDCRAQTLKDRCFGNEKLKL